MFNIDYKRNGAMRFLKIGRLTLTWSVSREYRPFKRWSHQYVQARCYEAIAEALA